MMQIWPEKVPRYAGDLLDLNDIFGWNSFPLNHCCAGKPKTTGYPGEHAVTRVPNSLHSIVHNGPLTTGKQTAQAKCLPQVRVGQRIRGFMEIGHRIKRAREAARMSQSELAIAAKVSRGLVGQWESHRKKPGRDVLLRIANATTTSVGYLIGEEEFDAVTVTTATLGEVNLLRRYRRMSLRQRKNLDQLLDASVEIRKEMEHQGNPTNRETISSG